MSTSGDDHFTRSDTYYFHCHYYLTITHYFKWINKLPLSVCDETLNKTSDICWYQFKLFLKCNICFSTLSPASTRRLERYWRLQWNITLSHLIVPFPRVPPRRSRNITFYGDAGRFQTNAVYSRRYFAPPRSCSMPLNLRIRIRGEVRLLLDRSHLKHKLLPTYFLNQ